MISTKKLSVSLVRNYPLGVRQAIRLQTAKYYNASFRGSSNNNHHHRQATCSRRYLSSDKDKPEVSIEELARSLSQLSSQQQPVVELAKRLSPAAQREIVQLMSNTTTTTAAAAATASNGGGIMAAAAMAANEAEAAAAEVPAPSYNDLKFIALAQAIPFLGFGFMDNAILIIAGDMIDTSLGVILGISTLCAAAIGNIISDVAGIMMGTVIEDFCTNYLKLPIPNLTTPQRQLRSVRFASQLGCGVGIVVGCIIGMFPLFFIDPNKNQTLKRDAALQNIFQDVMSDARTLIGAQSASLFILVDDDPDVDGKPPVPNKDGKFLYAKYFDSNSGEVSHRTFKVGKGIVSRSALTGQTWNVKDVDSEPDFSQEMTGQTEKVKNMVCVPVLDSDGQPFAVIRAFNKVDEGSLGSPTKKVGNSKEIQRRGFTNNDVQVLKALASHISVSLQYMYQEREADSAMGVKDTIRILKEHGLAGIAEDRATLYKRKQPLFPEPDLILK